MRKSIRKHRAALARTSAAVATGVALLALALPGPSANGQASPGWSTYGYDVRRTGFNPTETRLLPATVGGLHRLWRVNLGGVSITSPIVARGLMVRGAARTVIYVGTEHGNLVAVNASGRVEWNRSLGSATTTCPNTPDDVFGIGGTPVLDPVAGRLYVAVNDGASGHVFVYALDAATGKTVTGWPVSIDNDPLHMHVWGALTLWQGTLYVTTGGMCDIPPYWGRVIAIHTATPSIAASWSVVHVGDEVKHLDLTAGELGNAVLLRPTAKTRGEQ